MELYSKFCLNPLLPSLYISTCRASFCSKRYSKYGHNPNSVHRRRPCTAEQAPFGHALLYVVAVKKEDHN